MTGLEQDDLARAERLRYEDTPCSCVLCFRAAVNDRPLRFVPTLTHDGGDELRAFHPQRRRVEVVGHWAHGEELARWYQARAACFSRAATSPTGRRVLALVGSREPGEDG